jgi:protein-disulfide isomerase
MLIFSDFECPFCEAFATQTLPTLRQRYVETGKVLLAFRNLPLPIHSHAARAAMSAACAAHQGKFWVMHDSLFHPPVRLGEPDLMTHARDVGLDVVAFANCMATNAAPEVAADTAAAQEVGVTGTPSFIIGTTTDPSSVRATEAITGNRPLTDFVTALDRALAKASTP